jgi:hypothetical protein
MTSVDHDHAQLRRVPCSRCGEPLWRRPLELERCRDQGPCATRAQWRSLLAPAREKMKLEARAALRARAPLRKGP